MSKLIAEHISSVEQLEILLLLRTDPRRDWDAELVARELRVASRSVQQRLVDFVGRGFVSETAGRFRYEPTRSSDANAVDDLARVYSERRVSIIQLIFSKPDDAMVSFANAFDFRRGK